MKPVLRFFVAGIPKSMSVGKSLTFKRKDAPFAQHFQKRVNTEWAVMVGQVGREYAPPQPLAGALAFHATFLLPMPQEVARRFAKGARIPPIKRPDLDNLVHKLTDFFNGVFWLDDSQVTDIAISKRYAFRRGTGVEISVHELTVEDLIADDEYTEQRELVGAGHIAERG